MYPMTLYAPTGGSVTADDAAHHKALGPGWSENPFETIDEADAEGDADEPDAPEAPKKTRKKS